MFTSFFLKRLNKKASSPKNHPERVLESLRVCSGQAIADIGSGGGYFTLEFARGVGESGRVYAVDTEQKYLSFIKRRSEQEGLGNIVFVLVKGGEMDLPQEGLDLVFARNVFHHLSAPEEYFRYLKRFLKSSGKVAVIDYRPQSGFSHRSIFRHYAPVEVVLREMENAGYALAESFNFLPEQTFSIFGQRDVSQ